MKMDQTECSETSAYKIQTPGNYPEENIQHTEHGKSLKSKIFFITTLRKVKGPTQHPVKWELLTLSPGSYWLKLYHKKNTKSHSGLSCQSFTSYYPSIHEERLIRNM